MARNLDELSDELKAARDAALHVIQEHEKVGGKVQVNTTAVCTNGDVRRSVAKADKLSANILDAQEAAVEKLCAKAVKDNPKADIAPAIGDVRTIMSFKDKNGHYKYSTLIRCSTLPEGIVFIGAPNDVKDVPLSATPTQMIAGLAKTTCSLGR